MTHKQTYGQQFSRIGILCWEQKAAENAILSCQLVLWLAHVWFTVPTQAVEFNSNWGIRYEQGKKIVDTYCWCLNNCFVFHHRLLDEQMRQLLSLQLSAAVKLQPLGYLFVQEDLPTCSYRLFYWTLFHELDVNAALWQDWEQVGLQRCKSSAMALCI